jgi:hypothetical protein
MTEIEQCAECGDIEGLVDVVDVNGMTVCLDATLCEACAQMFAFKTKKMIDGDFNYENGER